MRVAYGGKQMGVDQNTGEYAVLITLKKHYQRWQFKCFVAGNCKMLKPLTRHPAFPPPNYRAIKYFVNQHEIDHYTGNLLADLHDEFWEQRILHQRGCK